MTRKIAPMDGPKALFDLHKWNGDFIVFTHRRKPVAYLLSARHYDEEDIDYMTGAAFWKMIRKRRQEPTIPLQEAMARLEERERAERTSRSRGKPRKAQGVRKGRQNATA